MPEWLYLLMGSDQYIVQHLQGEQYRCGPLTQQVSRLPKLLEQLPEW